MNNLFKNKKRILKIFVVLAILIGMLMIGFVFISLMQAKSVVKSYYKSQDENVFISNYDTIKSDDFKPEMDILDFDLKEVKVASYYKANNYKGLDQAVITDFFYLKRKNIISWEVERYESSYIPYYDQADYSLEDAYSDMKDSVKKGDITKGLTPDEERLLNQNLSQGNHSQGEIIDYIEAPDGTIVEVVAGEDPGTNYLVRGESQEKLGIENIMSGVFSSDSKLFIYTTGHYVEAIGELIPNSDIWVSDLKDNNTKVFDVADTPEELSLFSDGKIIAYGTYNSVGTVNIDGSNQKILLNFDGIDTSSGATILPKFTETGVDYVIGEVPDKDYMQTKTTQSYKVFFDGRNPEKM